MLEIDKGIIDINFDDDVMRFDYPMKEPVSFSLGEKFLQEKIIFNFIIMIELGNKYKKIAKGDIELASKYFLGDKKTFEKWIYIRPFQSQIENFGIHTDLLKNELNNGKIFVKIELQESLEEYKTKYLLYQKDNQISSTSPNDFNRKNYPGFNKDLNENELNKNNQFDDNLSDVSISILDVKEEDRNGLELDQLIDDDYIENLKQLIQNNYKTILPKDPIKLKQMNESLYK